MQLRQSKSSHVIARCVASWTTTTRARVNEVLGMFQNEITPKKLPRRCSHISAHFYVRYRFGEVGEEYLVQVLTSSIFISKLALC